MGTIINVPFTENQIIDDLNKKSLKELREAFEFKIKDKNCYKNVSFKKHILYYEFMTVSPVALMPWNIPPKEIQEKVLLSNIEGFESYLEYSIDALCLAIPDDSRNYTTYETPKKYFLKGKFTNEKQFYIFFLIK